ncbi:MULTISPECIES: molybdopterin molybdotransferase MoeA [Acinetobacter]|uniref:Molybdopterin molybdenumtransferase n=1 Tax=Acinetobacter parvus DSM 16617 = CIP 108168 TaxID=981333 RepID=N8RSB1_9GAMM|nr:MULTISPECIES: molybdopterin molybdotransferase MoeA [Acinetobacter]ENU37002.1 hypothetical protein F988_00809 [Acinetobacter parvus DSM 16617 = CIP 108168]ENU84774.1 hypothetical protein F974_00078 [Acinetobacter sp. CIP 102159]ENU90197.1 hypothetical protein F972_00410 [Acinetobacter sp. CIP 102529]ENU97168.1 hypothetical protein F970_00136 [Acinetobacter sp. CIP 102082]MCU4394903.1 molybdopterin molybdotransferase MoeA [Acinetobacter parvus]
MNYHSKLNTCISGQNLISVDQALNLILDTIQPLDIENINLSDALSRYLAKSVYSKVNLPFFPQSSVDGYALYCDSNIEVGTKFKLIGEIRAGQTTELKLQTGQAVRIFTGAKIPEGTTTVAAQEMVQHVDSKNIIVLENLELHTNIRDIGEEISAGECLGRQGDKLSIGGIAALSMAGIHQVTVYKYPKVVVVITGDEVSESVLDLASGKIFDANSPLIYTWFSQRNQQVTIHHVEDNKEDLKVLLNNLSQNYDLILTTGGVSVGDYDFIRPVALDLGFKQIFWKVKQKPGKPMLFAEFKKANQSACYLLGLPGNPAAVYVGMQIYTECLLSSLQGQKTQPKWFQAEICHDLVGDTRERFLRMVAHFEQAKLTVKSLNKQHSHMISNLMQANCIVRIPPNTNVAAGQLVQGIFI